MRRLRAGDERTPQLPGGAGAPPGDITIPCEELADGRPRGLPEACRGLWPPQGSHAREPRQDETVGQKARPGAGKTPRWSAERRPRPPKEGAANGTTGAPLGAPSPRLLRGGRKRRRRTRRRKEYGQRSVGFAQDP